MKYEASIFPKWHFSIVFDANIGTLREKPPFQALLVQRNILQDRNQFARLFASYRIEHFTPRSVLYIRRVKQKKSIARAHTTKISSFQDVRTSVLGQRSKTLEILLQKRHYELE